MFDGMFQRLKQNSEDKVSNICSVTVADVIVLFGIMMLNHRVKGNLDLKG